MEGNKNTSYYSQNTFSAMMNGIGSDKSWGFGSHYTWKNDGQDEIGVSVVKTF